MAMSKNIAPSRFHNLSASALADEIGRLDALMKAYEAELKAVKDEFKARGLTKAAGADFTVTASEQIAGRLDTKMLREFLGAEASRFETPVISQVIRIKPARRPIALAA